MTGSQDNQPKATSHRCQPFHNQPTIQWPQVDPHLHPQLNPHLHSAMLSIHANDQVKKTHPQTRVAATHWHTTPLHGNVARATQ